MTKLFLTICLGISLHSMAQTAKKSPILKKEATAVALTPAQWNFADGKATFVDYKGKRAMKLVRNSGLVVLKDVLFKDGTIEFDIEPIAAEFAQAIYFHRKDDKEQEIVYLRTAKIGNKLSNDGIQYCPYLNGVNMWDMYPEYQGSASAKVGEWNHMKLVISGSRLRVFVNRSSHPALDIPKLEGSTAEGSIAFEGASYLTNIQIKPGEVDGVSPMEAPDLTQHDVNYLRKWAVTIPQDLPDGRELSARTLPSPELFRDSIIAERRGLLNLTRKYGANTSRRVVWLQTKILAQKAVKINLQVGFSDEVWIFLNYQMVLVDKNLFQGSMRKDPDGRISIQNTTVGLQLNQGENDLLIGVANDFYGWGIMARLERTEGIMEIDNVSPIVSLAGEIARLDLASYLGTYSNGELPFKLSFSKKGNVLMAQISSQEPVTLQALGNHTFIYAPYSAVFAFNPITQKVMLKQGADQKEFSKE